MAVVGTDVVGMADGKALVGIPVGSDDGAPYKDEATNSRSSTSVGDVAALDDGRVGGCVIVCRCELKRVVVHTCDHVS